jgi:ADP-heptose:LPS heptosyltransferase
LKLKTKIIVDKIAGQPLVFLLNVFARTLGFFLRINHSLDSPVKTIVVSKFIGIGSIVQSMPLLKTLRKNYPKSRIIFVTHASNLHLFHFIDEVDEVFHISDKNIGRLINSNVRLLIKLWSARPDLYIDLEIYSNYSSLIATISLARNRMGFYKNDKRYRKGIYTHMMFFNMKSPVFQAYLQFARLLGCKDIDAEISINKLKIGLDDKVRISQKLNNTNFRNYILVNPNASDLRLERRWPKENMVLLIKALTNHYLDSQIILIGDSNESHYVGEIAVQVGAKQNLLDSSGKFSLPELIALIANAELLITNDTGPMHLAFALKTKTVSLFGPCSPQQYGGMGNTISIYKNVYCSPCVHEFLIPPCNGDNQCMKKIAVSEVLEATSKALRNEFSENNFHEYDFINSETRPLGVILR